ncbi:MAG: ABC transporter ATP-binding protein [Spirochaetales bacterium]|nr:ABC transporter ATP-binding protein [Spirochaetales bacterium]MBQ7644828.1 ABC transporter ATP-binding protein [Spirochaetales bacterium]
MINEINSIPEVILDIKNLRVSFFTSKGEVKAVDDISYHVNKKEVIAIVGESGCGKSVSQMSILQLIQSPPGKILGGEIYWQGDNLLKYTSNSKQIRAVRGAQISMIFQEPMTALNPVMTIGAQLTEVIRTHKKMSRKEAWEIGVEALRKVEIPDPEKKMKAYSFELSGGMRQRVMIAMAVACNSQLIIADEPTTALDVTTQSQVMELLMSVVKSMETSMILVTHNLGLVTRYAKRIYVMYAGKIVESGSTEDILTNPKHPYTIGLLKSVPKVDANREEKLVPIKGAPLVPVNLPSYCRYYSRCDFANERCKAMDNPVLRQVGENDHFAACHNLNQEEVSNE